MTDWLVTVHILDALKGRNLVALGGSGSYIANVATWHRANEAKQIHLVKIQ